MEKRVSEGTSSGMRKSELVKELRKGEKVEEE